MAKKRGFLADLREETGLIPDPLVLDDKGEISITPPTRKQFMAYNEATTHEDRLKALIGDNAKYDALCVLYDDEPGVYWTKCTMEIYDYAFGKGAYETEKK